MTLVATYSFVVVLVMFLMAFFHLAFLIWEAVVYPKKYFTDIGRDWFDEEIRTHANPFDEPMPIEILNREDAYDEQS